MIENYSSGRYRSTGLKCMMFWFVELEPVAKILVWGKTMVVVSINLLYLEQCIVRSDTLSLTILQAAYTALFLMLVMLLFAVTRKRQGSSEPGA